MLALLLVFLPGFAAAQDLVVSSHKEPVPEGLAAAVAGTLAPAGMRVVVAKGPATLDFWWVASLPAANAGPGTTWTDIAEGSLVGVVRLSADFRDIRGRIIKPGVYTLRFGLQPQNGDHLGVSPFREFLLLGPAAADTKPEPLGHDGTIEISKLSIGGSHPGVWSLDPPVAREAPLNLLRTELGHDAVVVEVPVSRQGKPSGTLRFGLVLLGKIEA